MKPEGLKFGGLSGQVAFLARWSLAKVSLYLGNRWNTEIMFSVSYCAVFKCFSMLGLCYSQLPFSCLRHLNVIKTFLHTCQPYLLKTELNLGCKQHYKTWEELYRTNGIRSNSAQLNNYSMLPTQQCSTRCYFHYCEHRSTQHICDYSNNWWIKLHLWKQSVWLSICWWAAFLIPETQDNSALCLRKK